MGIVLSCFKENNSGEYESLLGSQQNGGSNGVNDSFDAAQEQAREHERKVKLRDQELKNIVLNTNDKLIDISMISNSGIVVQSCDVGDSMEMEGSSNINTVSSNTNANSTSENNIADSSATISRNKLAFTELSPSEKKLYLTTTKRNQISKLYENISNDLNTRLQCNATGELTMSF